MDSVRSSSIPPSTRSGGPQRRRRRRRGTAFSPRYDDVLLGLLGVLVVGSLLAIGSVHWPSVVAVGVIATVGGALAVASSRVERPPLPSVICFLLAGYTLLQAVPLPLSWVQKLSPVAADAWGRALRAFGEPAPRFAALSLAPRATLLEGLKWWTYGCTFLLAIAVMRVRGPKAGVVVVFVAGALAAAITLVHGVIGATEVFGLYDPTFVPGRWTVGPLLNPNNLSGYLNLSIFCGVGLLLGSSAERFRVWLAFGITLLIATSLLAASRGGVIGLLLGSVLLVPAGLWLRRGGTPLPPRTLVALAGFGALGLIFAMIGATRETFSALYDANLAKLELSLWAKPMILDHRWFGVGRGAFETVLPAYHLGEGHVSYTNPENFVAQWASEWGIGVTVLALAGFAWAFRLSQLQVRRSTTAMAVMVGVIALLAQNLVDLALEVPAVVIALAVALASVKKEQSERSQLDRRKSLRAALVIAVAGAPLLIASTAFGTQGIALVRLDLYDRYRALDVKDAAARAQFRGELRRQTVAFPADPYLPLLGALVAWRGSEDPIPWLTRTLERDLSGSRAHFVLANVLQKRRATGQALMELRLAIEADPAMALQAAPLAVTWTKDFELLKRAIPADLPGIEPIIIMLRHLPGPEDDALRDHLLNDAAARDPNSVRVLSARGDHLLDSLSGGAERCSNAARRTCVESIEKIKTRLEQLEPGAFAATEIGARLLMAEGQADRAEAMLSEYCFGSADRAPCLCPRLLAAAETEDHGRLTRAAKDYTTSGCSTQSDCLRVTGWVGTFLSKRGHYADALAYLESYARDTGTLKAWLAVADCAERAGATGRQIGALRQAQRLPGGQSPEVKLRLERAMASSRSFLLKKSAPGPGSP